MLVNAIVSVTMTKILLIVFALGLLYFGWTQYQQKKAAGELGALAVIPAIGTDTNSEVSNSTNIDLHCISSDEINAITNLHYGLQNEVYTPAIKILNCSYENAELVDNIKPSISYKISFTKDSNGIWTSKQNVLRSEPSYAEASDFPNSFANLNPVHEINQGDFYGHNTSYYVELNYTPVSEGQSTLFTRGMQIMDKILGNSPNK
ncbi:hypothetical protein BH10PAT2_BH10PAT2_1480 [soil metagenome]